MTTAERVAIVKHLRKIGAEFHVLGLEANAPDRAVGYYDTAVAMFTAAIEVALHEVGEEDE